MIYLKNFLKCQILKKLKKFLLQKLMGWTYRVENICKVCKDARELVVRVINTVL